MLKLDQLKTWKELSSPYGNSEEIPPLLIKLSETHNESIADEIIWEYIYHQGSVYENTLATVPYLIHIVTQSNNTAFNVNILASLGVVVIGLDEPSLVNRLFSAYDNNVLAEDQFIIEEAYFSSLKTFKTLLHDYSSQLDSFDEETKRYFLISYLVTQKKHHEAEVFINFSGNDEYMFVCPHCEEETFLCNEENILNAYAEDPTYKKEQKNIAITLNDENSDLIWLSQAIDEMNIKSLKPLVKYFKGSLNCPYCAKQSNVFDGIMIV